MGGKGFVDSPGGSDRDSARRADHAGSLRTGVGDVPGWWEAIGVVGALKILVLVALVAWLYEGHLIRLYKYWQEPDWSHGFLIPLFSLYLINTKKKEILTGEHSGSIVGLLVVCGALWAYWLSIQWTFAYPQPLSLLPVIAGLVLLLRGWRTFWYSLFPIGFLILSIPPPVRAYRGLTQPLQQCAAAVSTWVLNAFPGGEVERSGVNIAYFMNNGHSGTFAVAGACSGMRSLMAFIALGLAMAYFAPRPAWQRVTMALAVVPVALVCNILRVVITGGLQMYGHQQLAAGPAHTLLGFLLFGLGFFIYMGILWCMDHLVVDEDDATKKSAASEGSRES